MREALQGDVWHSRCCQELAAEVLRSCEGYRLHYWEGVAVPLLQPDQDMYDLVHGDDFVNT